CYAAPPIWGGPSAPTRRPSDLWSAVDVDLAHVREVDRPVHADVHRERLTADEGSLTLRSIPNRIRAAAGELDPVRDLEPRVLAQDRKSTRLNSSHVKSSYADFC